MISSLHARRGLHMGLLTFLRCSACASRAGVSGWIPIRLHSYSLKKC